MLKKVVAMAVAAAMVMSLMACGGSPKEGGNAQDSSQDVSSEGTKDGAGEGSTEKADEDTKESTEGDTVLTVWCWNDNVQLMKKAAELYNEIKGTNITVNVEEIAGSDIALKLSAAGESQDWDTLPDIIQWEDVNFAKYQYAYPDMFLEMSDSVNWDNLAKVKPGLTTIDGKHYGMPIDSGAVGAFWNTELLAEAGYKVEDLDGVTWERLIEIGKDYNEKTGKYLLSVSPGSLARMMAFAETNVFNEDGSLNIKGNETLYEIAEIIKQLRDNNIAYCYTDWNDNLNVMANGTTAGSVDAVWMLVPFKDFPELQGKLELVNMPVMHEGASISSNNGGSSWFITSGCDDVDTARDLLEYMFADEGMDQLIDTYTELGYLSTYLPIVTTDYYATVDDGFYPKGVWKTAAEFADNVPEFKPQYMYNTTMDEINNEFNRIWTEDADVKSTIDAMQDTLEFQMD